MSTSPVLSSTGLNLGSNPLSNMSDPVNPQDGVTKNFLTTTLAAFNPTTATNANNVAVVDDVATNATELILWSSTTGGNVAVKSSSTKLTWNPSTGILSATKFAGDGSLLTGIAAGSGNATAVAITDDVATNATVYPTWVTATTGNLPEKTSSTKLSFNPSTGILNATKFAGDGSMLTGLPTGGLTTAQTSAGATGVLANYPQKTLSANKSFAAADDAQSYKFSPAGSYSLTFTAGMGWTQGIFIALPATGTISFLSDGTTLINGATTPQYRTLSSSQRNVAVTVHDTDSFDISGF